MAKYDEFGRPIYETAEEYNKARRTGANARTYESPEGDAYIHNPVKENYHFQSAAQRQPNQTASKKGVKVALIAVLGIIIVNVGIMVAVFCSVSSSYDEIYHEFEDGWIEFQDPDDYEDYDDYDDDEDDWVGEYIGDDTTPLPDGFETFSYNGQTYTLPMTYEEVAQTGLVVEEGYEIDDLYYDGFEEILFLNDENGVQIGLIRISNSTGEEIPLGKCQVDYFYAENPVAYDGDAQVPDFTFGDGLSFESSYEDLVEYFGEPYYHYESHSGEFYIYDSYEWQYYGEDEVHRVNVVFWNGVISQVDIEKRAYEY